jgi:hypothetical protein
MEQVETPDTAIENLRYDYCTVCRTDSSVKGESRRFAAASWSGVTLGYLCAVGAPPIYHRY